MSLDLSNFFLRLGRLTLYIVPFLLGCLLTYLLVSETLLGPVEPNSPLEVSFIVEKGANLRTIAKKLEREKLIKSWWAFYYAGKSKAEKSEKLIQAGEYKLSRNMSSLSILKKILSAEVIYYRFTIPEGLRLSEIAERIAQTGLIARIELERAFSDPNILQELGIINNTLEGHLFPETYQFSRPIDARTIVLEMVNQGRKQMTDEMISRSIEIGMPYYHVLILASIIEKETGKPEERPIISSVFHNRLRIGMPLQSDPTVIYGLKDFDGNLTKADLKRNTPYNTYTNVGLPPSPICSPGASSIKAALYPADSDYLYFVAKGDGSHHFSATLKEHNEAVAKHQKSIKLS
ncbi:MAG: endolytic transglycosylase MltG [Deltaproteobacteria bacterium]|nr:endolytic transglycosylase MltG [Deltaproteobacteria bacterium]